MNLPQFSKNSDRNKDLSCSLVNISIQSIFDKKYIHKLRLLTESQDSQHCTDHVEVGDVSIKEEATTLAFDLLKDLTPHSSSSFAPHTEELRKIRRRFSSDNETLAGITYFSSMNRSQNQSAAFRRINKGRKCWEPLEIFNHLLCSLYYLSFISCQCYLPKFPLAVLRSKEQQVHHDTHLLKYLEKKECQQALSLHKTIFWKCSCFIVL